MVQQGYLDAIALLDHCVGDSRIDTNRVCLSGISQGAMLCYYGLKKDKCIKMFVPVLGSPNFVDLVMYMGDIVDDSNITTNQQKLLHYVQSIDSYQHILHHETRPILMINGTKDDVIPSRFAQTLYAEYQQLHGEQNNVTLFVAEEYHYFFISMMCKAVQYIKEII